MQCPYCGKDMLHGNLTGHQVVRLVPDGPEPKPTHRIFRGAPKKQYENGLEGLLLDVEYSGLSPWISADFCRDCKKVIFDADVLHM